MKKPSLQEIVAQIKKEAVTPPGMGGGGVGVGGGGVGVAKSPVIAKMQEAIQDLAQLISKTINYQNIEQSMQHPETAEKIPFQEHYSTDMFTNFMIGNYLKRSDVQGVEWGNDPQQTQMVEKQPTDLKNMYLILDGLKRIGAQSAERWADGSWGWRTNNALKNIAAIATALVRLSDELGMHATPQDLAELQNFKNIIPAKDTDLSFKQKVEWAPTITRVIQGIQTLFLNFRNQILQKPAYRAILQGAPIATFGPKKEGMEVTPQEKALVQRATYASLPVTINQEYVPAQFRNVKMPALTISGADLLSPQDFESWAAKNPVLANIKQQNPASWPNLAKDILEQVKSQIDQKLAPTQSDFGPGF